MRSNKIQLSAANAISPKITLYKLQTEFNIN